MSQFDIVLQELETIRDERRTHANTANRVGTAMIDMLGLLGNLDFLPLTGGAMKNSNLVTNLNADLLDGHHAADFATASALATLADTVAGHTSAISTLEGYFTGGVANRALRLDSDDPCTAWGQRYWQDGVPQSISGTLDGVENIIMSGVINIGGFVIEKTADGLKFNGNIYATGGVAALGATGASGGGGGGSAQYLRDLLDVNVSAMSEGQVLTYRNGYWTAEAAQTPSLTAYATKTWVQQQGYLTQHQSLAAYATQQWVNERGFAYGADLSDLANYVQQTYVEKVNGKGLSTNDFTNELLSKLNGIQAGANYYEHPTGGANTTITAASGKVLSAIAVDNLGHVTSVGSKTLAPADIPALDASKITSGTFDVARIPNLDASKITSGTFATARIPDLSSIYLLKVAGESYPITNSLYIGSVTGRGVFVKDPAGNYVPAFYQNGENLWIGSTQTLDTHHRGQTYISAGYDGQHGNPTIYVCVPNDANNGGTNYGVWHSGNDGSGSGLDADLLDGHDSGYFATASALTTLAGTVSAQGGRITTLEGYFTNGSANSALRLAGTSSYTAWGQTYWQNGVPKSISGAMTSVDSINALAYFSSSRVGIGKSTPSRKLHVYDSNRLLMRLEASNSRYVDLGVDDDGLNIVTGNTTNSVWVSGNVIISSGDIDVQGGVIKIGDGTISWNSDGEYFEFSHTIASLGGVSALGTSGTGGGGTITTQYLRDLLDVNIGSSITAGHVLTYRNGYWVPEATQVPSLTDYALKTWVQQQGYLTQHQSLAAYATQQWVYGRGFAYNADLQDLYNYAESAYVKALGTSGDNVTWTRNGATNNLTVPFATDSKALRNFFDSRPASANNQYGDGKLRHYMATSEMTTGKPPVDAHIIHSAWDYNNGYDAQLAIGNANSGLFFRTQSQGTWQAWKQVATADSYLPLAGGTMTGSIALKSNLSTANYPSITGHAIGINALLNQHGTGDNGIRGGLYFTYGRVSGSSQDKLNSISLTCLSELKSDPWNGNYGLNITADNITWKGETLTTVKNINDSAGAGFADVLKGYSGTFFFYGNNLVDGHYDWVGLQIGSSVDKGQITFEDGTLAVRHNDSGGTDSTHWSDWKKLAFVSDLEGYLPLTAGSSHPLTGSIAYRGSSATFEMIRFKDSGLAEGAGIAIGGGGPAIIGGGESASFMLSQVQGYNEVMYVGNDQGVKIITNLQSQDWNTRKEFDFDSGGSITLPGNVVSTAAAGSAFRLKGSSYDVGLHLGAGGTNRGIYEFSPKGDWLLYFDASNTILNYGKVGIGTSSPGYTLDVNGEAKANYILFKNYNDGGNAGYCGRGGSATNQIQLMGYTGNTVAIGANSSIVMTFDTNNRVGIGTTTPDSKLHVVNECHFAGGAKFNNICIEVDNSIAASGRGSEINNYNGQLLLQYNTSTHCSICYGGGNVGIGKINPAYKLDVNGDMRAAGHIYGGNCLFLPVAGSVFIDQKNMLTYNSAQMLSLGYGMRNDTGTKTDIYGKEVEIKEKVLRIGSCVIDWDSTNNMLRFSGGNGIYAMGAVSALGIAGDINGQVTRAMTFTQPVTFQSAVTMNGALTVNQNVNLGNYTQDGQTKSREIVFGDSDSHICRDSSDRLHLYGTDIVIDPEGGGGDTIWFNGIAEFNGTVNAQGEIRSANDVATGRYVVFAAKGYLYTSGNNLYWHNNSTGTNTKLA